MYLKCLLLKLSSWILWYKKNCFIQIKICELSCDMQVRRTCQYNNRYYSDFLLICKSSNIVIIHVWIETMWWAFSVMNKSSSSIEQWCGYF